MEDIAIYGLGIGALLVLLGVNFLINSVVMWFVVRFMASVPDVTFVKCIVLVLWMTIVSVVMFILLIIILMILDFGVIIWLFLYFKALKVTIEAVLDITEGGWTILIFYILVQIFLGWLMMP